jgi:DNA-binding NarL/FixJ family response regulator
MTSPVHQAQDDVDAASDTPMSAGSLLLIEDNPIDALRTMALLRTRVPDMSCRHVSTLADATPELLAAADCVLLDLSLPDAQDQEGLKEVLQRATDVPVVVLTGLDDPLQTGLESLRNGAQDYLTKDSLDAAGLERSIRYAIERKGFQVDLNAAAIQSAADALLARHQATSTAALASTAETQVRSAATAAAAAATDARNAVELTVANAAVASAETAALAAVLGAAEVASTAQTAAIAAAEAAIAAAAALAADATASAATAREATRLLAAEIQTRAAEATALAGSVTTAVVDTLLDDLRQGRPGSEPAQDEAADLDTAEADRAGVTVALDGAPSRQRRSTSSVAIRVLVLTAKLAVAVAIILTLILLLTTTSAS